MIKMAARAEPDDEPRLSDATLCALQEFLQEQMAEGSRVDSRGDDVSSRVQMQEDWQLSQFWYDDETADTLAREAITVAGPHGRVACISCPTLFAKLIQIKPTTCQVVLLEFDKRFTCYGDQFVFYDYQHPLQLPQELTKNSFDLVIADPPYLSDECLTKTAMTVKYLTKGKVLLCTGAIMEGVAQQLLGVKPCSFQPKHERNLANEFKCFVNYLSDL